MDINTVSGCIRAMNPGMGPQQQLRPRHHRSPGWQSSQHLSVFLLAVASLVLPLSTQNEPFCHPPITHGAFAPIKSSFTQHCKAPGKPCFLLHDWGRPECGSLHPAPPVQHGAVQEHTSSSEPRAVHLGACVWVSSLYSARHGAGQDHLDNALF